MYDSDNLQCIQQVTGTLKAQNRVAEHSPLTPDPMVVNGPAAMPVALFCDWDQTMCTAMKKRACHDQTGMNLLPKGEMAPCVECGGDQP